MQWALENISFDWFVILTGQTYPLRRLADFENGIAKSEFDAYVYHFDAYDEAIWPNDEAVKRYHFQYYSIPKFKYWHRLPPMFVNLLTFS